MKNEVEALKSSNGVFLDQNSNLQAQVTTLKGHHGVVGAQNATISCELKAFVDANEAMRVQLDRRARVLDHCRRNEESIAVSVTDVHRSRSPVRRCCSTLETFHHAPLPLYHSVCHTPFCHQRAFSTYHAPASPLPAPASPAKEEAKPKEEEDKDKEEQIKS